VPTEKLITVPDDIPLEKAVGSCLMGITALALIKESYEVRKGDTILVHAAAGGVGLLLCQLIKAAGATVIGTASTEEKCNTAKANGATHMINYSKEDWVKEVQKLAPNGVDCVWGLPISHLRSRSNADLYRYDGVGKSTWEGSLEVVKRKGHVIFFGSASGPPPPLDIQRLGKKVTKITRAVVFQYVVTREELEYYSKLLFQHLRDGSLNVKLHETYPLKEARRAHEDLEGRKTSGKSILSVD
jgi:NADPH:quinone reductase